MDNKQSEIQRAWQHYDIGVENSKRGVECQQRSDNNKANEYFQMSINEFSAMLKILPRDQKTAASRAHVSLGLAYESISRFQQAEDHYNLALKADPNNVHAKNVLQRFRAGQHYRFGVENRDRGIECQQRSDNNKANEYFQMSINGFSAWLKLLPRDDKAAISGAHVTLGLACELASRFQQAEDHYNLALKADPNNVHAKNNLQRFRAGQHYRFGVENRDRGIECQQRSDNNKANEYFQMSINEFSAWLKLLPRDDKAAISGAHVTLGLACELASRFQQAEDHYNLALKADPNNVHAKNVLQRFRAWQYYKRGIECQQRSDNNKANEYFQMSINGFSAMLKLLPRDDKAAISAAHNALGFVYESISRFQQAEDHYNLALKADPNNVHAKNNLQRLRAWQHTKQKVIIKPPTLQPPTLTDLVNSQPWLLPPKF